MFLFTYTESGANAKGDRGGAGEAKAVGADMREMSLRNNIAEPVGLAVIKIAAHC